MSQAIRRRPARSPQLRQIADNWVLTPAKPKAVIHFLGGAFFAAAPQVAYRRVLEQLAHHGYVIIATPFLNSTFDHYQIARDVYRAFRAVRQEIFLDYFPVVGMGHSMGCKIHLLMNCMYGEKEAQTRSGNIFLAYNNYSANRSIPFFKEISKNLRELGQGLSQGLGEDLSKNLIERNLTDVEFTPSPCEMESLIAAKYSIERNLLIKFVNDDIDEIPTLSRLLDFKFPNSTTVKFLNGTHLTSMGIDVNWQAGDSFSPLDALAQWFKQEVHKDNEQLERVLLQWLKQNLPSV